MEAYSKEFRRDVLAACDAGGSTREVAAEFKVSQSWVRRIKQQRRELGKIAPKTTRNRRKSCQPYADWLQEKLQRRPGIYLRQIQESALSELGWEVSEVTLGRACRELKQLQESKSYTEAEHQLEDGVRVQRAWSAGQRMEGRARQATRQPIGQPIGQPDGQLTMVGSE